MTIEKLNPTELLEINGGNDKDYNLGYAIGSHIRSGAETLGNLISWAVDAISPFA